MRAWPVFDDLVYGGPLTTGYQPGEVTFGLGAIGPNLRIMPAHLMQAMPMLVLGLIALAWIIVRWLVLRRADGEAGAVARRDLWVGLSVAASWFAIWGLYSAYTWTTDPTSVTVQVVRFYVPAIGAIALLGAWLVTRIPGRCMASRPDLSRRHHGVVRPRRVGIPRHVRSVRRPTERLDVDGRCRTPPGRQGSTVPTASACLHDDLDMAQARGWPRLHNGGGGIRTLERRIRR